MNRSFLIHVLNAFSQSSNGDPAVLLMKRFGVIEQSHKNAIPADIVYAARNKTVTPLLLYKELVLQPVCNAKIHHLSELSSPSIERLMNTVPGVIKNNPQRYPFLFPAKQYLDTASIGDTERENLWKMSDPLTLRNVSICEKMHHR